MTVRNLLLLTWAAWLNWWECHPVDQKVAGLIPGRVTYPGLGLNPVQARAYEKATSLCFSQQCFSLSLSNSNEKCPQVRVKKICFRYLEFTSLFDQPPGYNQSSTLAATSSLTKKSFSPDWALTP